MAHRLANIEAVFKAMAVAFPSLPPPPPQQQHSSAGAATATARVDGEADESGAGDGGAVFGEDGCRGGGARLNASLVAQVIFFGG